MRRASSLATVLLLLLAAIVPASALAESITAQIGAKRSAESRYFEVTGHNVSEPFLSFFDRNGGLDAFGYPRTEAFEENGRLVQYFQRNRMEYWPENPHPWKVQLALMGDLLLGPADPPVPPPADPAFQYFPETGHSVGPPFLDFFRTRGGITVFGYPTSEAYQEGAFLVQRFQRARLEFHPENPPNHQVQAGLLGDVYIFEQGLVPQELTAPVPVAEGDGWFVWGSWSEPTAGFLPFKAHNNEVAMQALDGTLIKPGESFRFSPILHVPGYVPGLGYGANDEYVWTNAGGTCAAATTFYRAAFNAGLQIVQVFPHTLASYPPYGWDATVAEGALDLIVRNDTPTELRVRAVYDRATQQMSVSIDGRIPPDRTVTRRGPYHLGNWRYEVFRDITYADGRQVTERRTISYNGEPPLLPPGRVPQYPEPIPYIPANPTPTKTPTPTASPTPTPRAVTR